MSTWYYSQTDQAVGPFPPEVLGKLVQAGVIDHATLVRQAGEEAWHPLERALASEEPVAAAPGASQEEPRYYYLDAAEQPVGPFDVATLRRLHAENVFGSDTLVSGVGDAAWVSVSHLLGLPVSSSLMPPTNQSRAHERAHPLYLPFERFVLLMGVTLSFYPFYLVPSQSRDLKAITGRERLEFTALLILGIVTLGLLLVVMMVLWAFDLERHGKTTGQPGRQRSLGLQVLGLIVLSLWCSWDIDNSFLSFLVGAILSGSALWLLQKEINLYAVRPHLATTPV